MLHPYKFYGRDMSGILFFIFASCEPITLYVQYAKQSSCWYPMRQVTLPKHTSCLHNGTASMILKQKFVCFLSLSLSLSPLSLSLSSLSPSLPSLSLKKTKTKTKKRFFKNQNSKEKTFDSFDFMLHIFENSMQIEIMMQFLVFPLTSLTFIIVK